MANQYKSLTNFYLTAFCICLFIFASLILMRGVILPCLVVLIIAYLLNPLVNRLENYGLSRRLSVSLIIFVLISFLLAFFAVLLPILYSQMISLVKFLIDKIPLIQDRMNPSLLDLYKKFGSVEINELINSLYRSPNGFIDNDNIQLIGTILISFLESIGGMLMGLLISGINVSSTIILALITPLLVFYIMCDWQILVSNITQLIPPRYQDITNEYLVKIDRIISAYIRGQLIVCLIMSIYYSISLSVVGLNYALLLGLISGLITFIPYVGTALCMISGLLISFSQFDIWYMHLLVLTVFIIGPLIEGNIIVPLFIGKEVGLHPIWIILGMVVCASQIGFLGILLSIPITAVSGVLVKSFVNKYKRSNFYESVE